MRTSQVLRQILTKNPSTKEFTVEHIVASMSDNGLAPPLLLFSIPSILPVPDANALTGLPAGVIASHMIAGRREIELPKVIRERSVPRRSLAVAIHTILPVLERLEKTTKRRWLWASHPIAERMLGVVVFLLALTIAFPILGFALPHAAAMFTIALGMAEQDGVAILVGVAGAVAALVLLTGKSLTVSALRAKAWDWIRGVGRRYGLKLLTTALEKLGMTWAGLLTFDWTQLLLLWDPERNRPAAEQDAQRGKRKIPELPPGARPRKATILSPAFAPCVVPV
ncbi:exopolysaccharide biosynthesis protein [Xanthobacter sp. V4C-4]|uniref:exopolysaccharide biosynthesis protein n=1 Tax=Xanthobacter cornucopiae TaxID=3119924 RepID=UPI0037284316